MFRVGVYDIFGKSKYNYFEEINKTEMVEKRTIRLREVLVNKTVVKNAKPYLIDFKNPNRQDFKWSKYKSIQASNRVGIVQNDIVFFHELLEKLIKYEKQYSSRIGFTNEYIGQNLENYFSYQKCIIKEKTKITEDEIIIPVVDNLSVDSQELLLNKFGNRNSTTLLWRSVAACIGDEEYINSLDLKDGDDILVVDTYKNKILFSKITLKEFEGRLIPSHKSFYDSFGSINKEYYQEFSNENLLYNYKDNELQQYLDLVYGHSKKIVPIKVNGKWELKRVEPKRNVDVETYPSDQILDNAKLILILDSRINIWERNSYKNPVIRYCKSDTISKGCSRFSIRTKNEIICYYDQCDGMHIVVQKQSKGNIDIDYVTLIKGTDSAIGGQVIHGEVNEDLAIKKGENMAEFLLRIGSDDRDGKLKSLIQIFSDENLDQSCNLRLEPSMKPGQGRARVLITCITNLKRKPFDQVSLDWDRLNDTDKTVNSIQADIPKAYPPPVALVESNKNIGASVYFGIKDFINHNQRKINWELNKTKWPNKDKKGVERFQRTNLFGNKENFRLPSVNREERELIIEFLEILKTRYEENPKQDIFKLIAWTYQGKSQGYFNDIIEDNLESVKSGNNIDAVQASFFANILEDEEDLIIVFRAVIRRLKKSYSGITNWLRCLYQILMYFEFISSKNISDGESYEMIELLCGAAINNTEHKNTYNYILRSILFMLKRRRVDPNFCKKDNDYFHYQLIVDLPKTNKTNNALHKVIKEFLDENGTLEGIPLGD